ncbi:hypothetical protein [Nonomuraea sp. NPDC050691]|uniref:hypothetical protein n=1 Tax=Nonomuraea sp. NPDC050691 TaxID=3155661 RepID=UPI0033D7AE43
MIRERLLLVLYALGTNGTDRENQEVSMLAPHLLQSALVFVDTVLVRARRRRQR